MGNLIHHKDESLFFDLTMWSIGSAAVRAVEPMSTVTLLAAGTLTRNYSFGNKLLSIYTISGATMAIVLAIIYDRCSRKSRYTACISTLAVIFHIFLACALIKHMTSTIIYLIAIISAVIPSALPGIARAILSSMGKNSIILALDAINVEIAWIGGPIIASWASKTNTILILIGTLAIAYLLAAITFMQITHDNKNISPTSTFKKLPIQYISSWSFTKIFSREVQLSLVDSFSIGLVEMAMIVNLPLLLWHRAHPISLTGILLSFLSFTGIIGGIAYWKFARIIPFQINTQTFISLFIISILALMTLITLGHNNLLYITIILGIMGFFITQLNIQRAISLEKATDPQFYAQGAAAQYACFALGTALASWGMSYLHNDYLLIFAIIIALISSLFIRYLSKYPIDAEFRRYASK